jgi:hypothetical protein
MPTMQVCSDRGKLCSNKGHERNRTTAMMQVSLHSCKHLIEARCIEWHSHSVSTTPRDDGTHT